jgi:hypothetical protein
VERTTIARETEELGENLPQRHFVPPQIPHDQDRFRIPDRSDGKPANNRLSYGAALRTGLVRFPAGQEILFCPTAPTAALWPNQLPTQWAPMLFPRG